MLKDPDWGAQFMALRTARGITRTRVERKTGITTRTLRLIEEGPTNPRQPTRTALLQLFGLTELPHTR